MPEVEVGEEEHARILAAIAEPGGSRVIEMAARAARRMWPGAELHVIHVFRSGLFDRPPPGGMSNTDLVDEAKLYLEHHVRMAKRQCSSPVTGHFAVGNPVKEIARAAKSLNADLLIVGKTDRMVLDRLLTGSVTDSIARAVGCSVLIVRPREHHATELD
jgi:nucleotide-binding universal stress UspA family protein